MDNGSDRAIGEPHSNSSRIPYGHVRTNKSSPPTPVTSLGEGNLEFKIVCSPGFAHIIQLTKGSSALVQCSRLRSI